MTLLFVSALVLEAYILWKFIKTQKKTNRLISMDRNVMYSQEVSKWSKYIEYVGLIVLYVAYAMFVNIESYIIFLPAVTLATIQVYRKSSDVKLYENGLYINRIFIRWQDIDSVELTNSNQIILASKELSLGQLKTYKIQAIDRLVSTIKMRLNVNNY